MMEDLAALKLSSPCLAQPTRANPSQLAGGRLRQLKANQLPELRWGGKGQPSLTQISSSSTWPSHYPVFSHT